jgi:hypothetical protein
LVLIWTTIPLMVLAVLWATGIVSFHPFRESRRLRAEETADRHLPPPDDERTHLAATVAPGQEEQAAEVMEPKKADAASEKL